MSLLQYKPLFRWGVPLAILLTLAACFIIATQVVWAGDGILGPNSQGRQFIVWNSEYGYGTCSTNPNATLILVDDPATVEDDRYPTTNDWFLFRNPGNVTKWTCTFHVSPEVVQNNTYQNFDFLCEAGPVMGDTYFGKTTVHNDGTVTLTCHINGSPHSYPDGVAESGYDPPSYDVPGHNDDGVTGGSAGDGGSAGADGTGDTGDTGTTVTGDTSGNTVDGAGATVEPQSGDNNNGDPPDHAGPQDNGNGNAPDHAGPQDNHDGIDKPNGNNGGNNGNGNGNGGN